MRASISRRSGAVLANGIVATLQRADGHATSRSDLDWSDIDYGPFGRTQLRRRMIARDVFSCRPASLRHPAGRKRDPRPDHHRPGDADPVRRDRLRRLAGLGQGPALERRLPLPRPVPPHRPRDHGRLPPPPHPPQLQERSLAARPAGDPRLGGDRGPGHLLGRRPPQAPRLLRRRGGSAQPPRRPRPRLARRPARPLPRPHGLALHPHPARQQGALRAGPDQGPDRSAGSTAPSSLGDRRPARCPSRSAG